MQLVRQLAIKPVVLTHTTLHVVLRDYYLTQVASQSSYVQNSCLNVSIVCQPQFEPDTKSKTKTRNHFENVRLAQR